MLLRLLILGAFVGAHGASAPDKLVKGQISKAFATLKDESPEVVSVVLRHWADHCECGPVPALCVDGELLGYRPPVGQSSGVLGTVWMAAKGLASYLPLSWTEGGVNPEHAASKINQFKLNLPYFGQDPKVVEFIKGWVAKVVSSDDKHKAIEETKKDLVRYARDLVVPLRAKGAFSVMLLHTYREEESYNSREVMSEFANVFAEQEGSLAWRLFLWRSVLIPSIQFASENGYNKGTFMDAILDKASEEALEFLKSFDEFLHKGEATFLQREEVMQALKNSPFVNKLRKALRCLRFPVLERMSISGMQHRQDLLQRYVIREHELYRCCVDLAEGRDVKKIVERLLSLIAQYTDCTFNTPSLRIHAITCRDLGWPLEHFAQQTSEPKFFWDEDSQRPLIIRTMGSESWLKPTVADNKRLKYLCLELAINDIVRMADSQPPQRVGETLTKVGVKNADWLYVMAAYEGIMPYLAGALKELGEEVLASAEDMRVEEVREFVSDALWRITVRRLQEDAKLSGGAVDEISKRDICLLNRDFIYHWGGARMGKEVTQVLLQDWHKTSQNFAIETYSPCVLKTQVRIS